MDEALQGLTKISRSTVITIVVAIGVAILWGPNNWATHLAYHEWNVLYAFVALNFAAQLAVSGVVITLVYLQFEEKIRDVATSLFYSEKAATRIVQKERECKALRASQLSAATAAA